MKNEKKNKQTSLCLFNYTSKTQRERNSKKNKSLIATLKANILPWFHLIFISSEKELSVQNIVRICNRTFQISSLGSRTSLLGTTDVWLKPMLTTMPEVRLAANNAKIAYSSFRILHQGLKDKRNN